MKVLIIPDVHGETFWKSVTGDIDQYDKVIFLGDYVDSFYINDEEMLKNLSDIIEFKKNNHDKVVLLFGNHELSYYDVINFGCSGFRKSIGKEIKKLIIDNFDLFQLTYQIEIDSDSEKRKYLFSHAGVNKRWVSENKKLIDSQNGNDLSEKINQLLSSTEGKKALSQVSIYSGGNLSYSSPIWTRPAEWNNDTVLFEYDQFVGHTPTDKPLVMNFDNGLQKSKIEFLDRRKNKSAYTKILKTEKFADVSLTTMIETTIKFKEPISEETEENINNEIKEKVNAIMKEVFERNRNPDTKDYSIETTSSIYQIIN